MHHAQLSKLIVLFFFEIAIAHITLTDYERTQHEVYDIQSNEPLLRTRERARWYTFDEDETSSRGINPSGTFGNPQRQSSDKFDVIIVGAGWAGIRAARVLHANGISYRVLEARDYIGGRSHSIILNWEGKDVPINIGSEWVVGMIENPIQKIVERYNVPYGISNFQPALYKENGGGPVANRKVLQLQREIYANGFMKYQAILQENAEVDYSLLEVAKSYLRVKDIKSNKLSFFEYFLRSNIEMEYAASLADLSTYWWDNDLVYEGNHTYINGGYSMAITKYSEPMKRNIELGADVQKIDYSMSPIKVDYKNEYDKLETIYAEKVIVTAPLGVLKAGAIAFEPGLPVSTYAAINEIGMGTLNKIFMFWQSNEVFWPKKTQWLGLVSERRPNIEFYNPSSLNGGVPMLIGFMSGRDAENLEAKSSNNGDYRAKFTDEAMDVLFEMFGKQIPNPKKTIACRWGSYKYSLGSYSYNKVGISEDARKKLSIPIDGRIYLAGEASSDMYFGTTTGAYLSGEKAAYSISGEFGTGDYNWDDDRTSTSKTAKTAKRKNERKRRRR